MTAAVTGASGHIGNNLCRELLKQGIKVKALVREDIRALQGLDIEFVKGEVSDKESLRELIKNSDVVFHLAAVISINGIKKDYIHKINVEGTRNVVEICSEQKKIRLIHFSSIHALIQYPLNKPLTEKNPLAGKDAYIYDKTKAEAERIVLSAVKKGLDAVIVNPTSVIGINDFKPSFLGQAVIKIAKGRLPALIPGGFDWVDVRDVAEGAISAFKTGKTGERYLLSGNWKSLECLAKEINKHTGRKNPIKISSFIAKIGLPFIYIYSKLTGEIPLYTNESLNILKYSNKEISSKKAENELGYTSRSFSDTIKDTVKGFMQNNKI